MKLWLVKFYVKYTTIEYIPKYENDKKIKNGKNRFYLGAVSIVEYEKKIELKEKEIHSYIVDSEEKADFLVEAFTSTETSAKKIELVG